MAQQGDANNYTQGHSNYTVATHLARTAESDAAFLLPYLKNTDNILDVGCGPGTITLGLAKYANEGTTIGVDISMTVLQKAKSLAEEQQLPDTGPGSIKFEEGDIIKGLAYPDNTFDVVYASQVFGHFPLPDLPVQALAEVRRVLKPGGLLATRDSMNAHFYPRRFDLDRLWTDNQRRVISKVRPGEDVTSTTMPTLFRKAGFDVDGGKVLVGAGTRVFAGKETREWLAWRATGQLNESDPYYQSWLDAGISKEEIQQVLTAVEQWAECEDAWHASLQCEMLAWK